MSSFTKDINTASKEKWNLLKEEFKLWYVHKIIRGKKNGKALSSIIEEVTIQVLYMDWALPLD